MKTVFTVFTQQQAANAEIQAAALLLITEDLGLALETARSAQALDPDIQINRTYVFVAEEGKVCSPGSSTTQEGKQSNLVFKSSRLPGGMQEWINPQFDILPGRKAA